MHHLYHTEAFVLAAVPHGETGKRFALLTREFGLLWATAQGIRTPQSKLRSTLQLFSKVQVTLVKGRGGWRITGALPIANVFYVFLNEPSWQEMFARVFTLMRRLVAGEETAPKLFAICDGAVAFCVENSPKPEDLPWVEVLLVLRILRELGYIGDLPSEVTFEDNDWSREDLSHVAKHRQVLVAAVNQAIQESQM